MTLKISVIIPAIDEAQVISAAIDSAVSAGADEIILADGGSRDGTPDAGLEYGVRLLTAAPGRASQQNAGAHIAMGDVLLFLHADCCLPAAGLAKIRQYMASENSLVGGYFRQRIDDPGWIYRWIESGNRWRARTLKWAYGDQAIFVRTSIFQGIGGFPDVPLMEDLYIMKRLKRHGRVVCIDVPLLVSARRWKKRGPVWQTLRNWTMLSAVHLGVSPALLARFYPRTT